MFHKGIQGYLEGESSSLSELKLLRAFFQASLQECHVNFITECNFKYSSARGRGGRSEIDRAVVLLASY